jgi:hypothetical protein
MHNQMSQVTVHHTVKKDKPSEFNLGNILESGLQENQDDP